MQGDVWSEALSTARGIKDKAYHAKALTALAPHLPVNQKCNALEDWLVIAGVLERGYVLKTLTPLIKALDPFIDQDDYVKIYTAIRDVSVWWP